MKKIREKTAGRADGHRQTDTNRRHRQSLQEKPAKTPAGAGKNRRGHTPAAGPAQKAEIMQGGGDGLQNGRAGEFYARGIKSIPGLFTTPPIVPPKPMQEPPAIPAKSTATSTSTAGRHQHRTQPPAAPPATAGEAAQHRATSTATRPQPQHHSHQHQPHHSPQARRPSAARARFKPNARPPANQDRARPRRYSRRGL